MINTWGVGSSSVPRVKPLGATTYQSIRCGTALFLWCGSAVSGETREATSCSERQANIFVGFTWPTWIVDEVEPPHTCSLSERCTHPGQSTRVIAWLSFTTRAYFLLSTVRYTCCSTETFFAVVEGYLYKKRLLEP